MKDILTQPQTKELILDFAKKPSQAVILVGPSGSGKTTTAYYLAGLLLQIEPDKLTQSPRFQHVAKAEDKKAIGIESVRQIIASMALKPSGREAIKRVIYIEDAHLMNKEAQNAFLKMLEEPPEATVFILGAISRGSLLPTIVSRTAIIQVKPINLEEAQAHFSEVSKDDVQAAWFLSEGQVGTLSTLLSSDEHPLKLSAQHAKEILSKNTYERLVDLQALGGSRQELEDFLEGLARVLKVLYKSTAASGNSTQTKRILQSVRLVEEIRTDLVRNALPRLALLRLVLNLSV